MKCPKCKHRNSEYLSYCEFCGEELPQKTQLKDKKIPPKWIAISTVVVILVCCIGILFVTGIGNRMITSVVAGTSLESEESKALEEHYQNGIAYMDDADYLNAVSEFALITKNHYRYPEAQKNIDSCSQSFAEKIDSEIASCVTEDDFATIYETLSSVDESLFDEMFALNEKIENLQIKYQEYLTALISEAEGIGDYAGALGYISKRNMAILSESESLAEKEISLKDAYREKVKSDAAALFESEGYESAVACLRAATEYFPDDEEINSLIQEYTAYQPVRLYDMSYFASGALNGDWSERENSASFVRQGTIIDNIGNEYSDGIKTASNPTGSWESYQLDKQYKKLTGKIIIDDESKSEDRVGYVKIIADGIEIYSSPKMTKGTEPVSFEIDVTGVDVLIVKMVRDWNYRESHFALVDCKFAK